MSAQPMIRSGDAISFPNAEAVLEATELVGVGGFGQVWKCRVRTWNVPGVDAEEPQEGEEYKAVKISSHGVQQQHALREEAMKIVHCCASKVMDSLPQYFFHGTGVTLCENPIDIYGLCMSYIDGMNLGRLISYNSEQAHTIAFLTSCGIMRDIFSVLRDLHSRGIIYGDVKPDNIMVGVDGKCTFVDFGIALMADNYPEGVEMPLQGTPEYMAPDLLSGRYDAKVDMWSAGCVGYLLATSRPVWQRQPGLSSEAQVHQVLNEFLDGRRTVDYSYIPGGPTGGMYTYYGEKGMYARMLRLCLEARGSRRISSTDIFDGTRFGGDCFSAEVDAGGEQQRRVRDWVLAARADGVAVMP